MLLFRIGTSPDLVVWNDQKAATGYVGLPGRKIAEHGPIDAQGTKELEAETRPIE